MPKLSPPPSDIPFTELIEPVALHLLGTPHRSSKRPRDVRFRDDRSLSVNFETATFFDHLPPEASGGLLDLIAHINGGDRSSAVKWLVANGYYNPEHRSSKPLRSKPKPDKPKDKPKDYGPARERKPTPPTFYIYRQEDGAPYLGVKRTADKKFYQHHWTGEWIDGAPTGPKIPYRLPELLQAEHDTVVIAEGEKDCDNLAALGFIATTNPGGAGNWSPDLNRYFEGRDVYVVPDHDEKGDKHLTKVGENLAPIARSIRVIRLPGLGHKEDASDWIDDGGTADKFTELMGAAPEWTPPPVEPPTGPTSSLDWSAATFTAEQLKDMKFPPVLWVVPDIIPAEGVGLLCSKPKFGKSWLIYDLCIACTCDRYTLGEIKPAQGDVLYLALEDSRRRLQKRMDKLLPTFGAEWPKKLTMTTEWRRLHEGGIEDIRAWYHQTKANGGKPIMVAIDVLAKVKKPSGNKQQYDADYEAISGLKALANELAIAILVVHHTRKMDAEDLMETVSGTYGVTGSVDTILVMANRASSAVLDIRGRDVESAELAIQFNKDTCRWTILGKAAEVHMSEQRQKIIAALKEANEPMKVTELMEATWIKRNAIDLLLGKMVKDAAIKRMAKGLYTHNDYTPPPKPEKPEKPKRPSSVHLSVVPKGGQMEKNKQTPENKGENGAICPSVPSVRGYEKPTKVFEYDANGANGGVRTDGTDGQMDGQAIEKTTVSSSFHLSVVKTDGTDGTEGTKH